MTYKEDYMKCKNIVELKERVRSDIIIAGIIGNTDRLKVIKVAAEEVANSKFKESIEFD